MVDKSTKVKKDKKPEEIVTVEEEDLFEDFPLSKGKTAFYCVVYCSRLGMMLARGHSITCL